MNRIVLVLVLAAALAGCGEKEQSAAGGGRDRLTLVLDYFPNADHAGIYAAQAAGDFEAAGLDVKIQTPPDPSAPLKLLQAGRADLAVSYEPELLLARDKGAQLVSVAALVQKPLTSIISLKGVRSAEDLEGKKVATAGIPYQSAYLKAIAARAGVKDYEEVNVGFNLTPAMLSGKVDATLGSFWNYEGTDLERRGRKPLILRMEELGVPTYNELVLVAPRKGLDREGASRIRRFLQALARGHERLREDPATAVDALLEANPDLERGLQTAVVERTLPVFFPEDESKPWGFQEPTEWLAYGRWMRENGLLKGRTEPDAALTNEFLPGQGLEQPRTDY
jgi:putative hydroxymethylpyrimidine transport system substrate-binding protein